MESALGGQGQDREAVRNLSNLWWLWLVSGVFWVAVGLVILQFDQASINTVGILIGLMFFGTSLQIFGISTLVDPGLRWLYWIFGVFMLVGGGARLHQPREHLRRDR